MSDTYSIRKLGGDKIALLGLLVAALLAARAIVGIRSALVLSEPIPLPGAGISVSVPIGNGWQSAGRWIHGDDGLTLSSSFLVGADKATASVVCRYLETAEPITPQARLQRQAADFGGTLQIGEMRTETLIFSWAQIRGQKMPVTVFIGTTTLPDDGQLDITVMELTGDTKQAEKAFKAVVESVKVDSRTPMAVLDKT